MAIPFTIDRDKWALLPSIYPKGDAASNTRKKYEIVAQVIDEANALFQQIYDLEDLAACSGVTLDYYGDNYGVKRNGLSDTAFRALLLARRANAVGGNSVNRILEFMSFYVDLSKVSLIELWDVATTYFLDATRNFDATWNLSSITFELLLDGSRPLDASWDLSGSPLQKYRGFYIQANGLSAGDRQAIREILPYLRCGGIYGALNT